jgi:hypothetical protein
MPDAPPKIGKWTMTSDHSPATGVPVLGWWGGMDIEAVRCNCRREGKSEEDWWWETRSGDTSEPRAWAEIDASLMSLSGTDF